MKDLSKRVLFMIFLTIGSFHLPSMTYAEAPPPEGPSASADPPARGCHHGGQSETGAEYQGV